MKINKNERRNKETKFEMISEYRNSKYFPSLNQSRDGSMVRNKKEIAPKHQELSINEDSSFINNSNIYGFDITQS